MKLEREPTSGLRETFEVAAALTFFTDTCLLQTRSVWTEAQGYYAGDPRNTLGRHRWSHSEAPKHHVVTIGD